ncbi:hypothetical protein BZL43_02915 [Pseudomonas sp. PICF141]|nr:hypothetical protein BZL43_02915 [Pseudomonas sp. PICF141]
MCSRIGAKASITSNPHLTLIVPTLRMGMPPRTLRVRSWDAERPLLHSQAERGNDHTTRNRCQICDNPPPAPLDDFCVPDD